ncbi:hypothetical protein SRHO_G00323580 [Serrasalmus rhombeus]
MRQYLMLLFIMLLPQLSRSLQIPCQAQLEQGVQYRKIFWYKVTESNSVVGLIMKDLGKNTTALYKHANHSYQIGDDLSLLLLSEPREKRETKCETYRCSVWPPVGYYIQESDYSLPQGCQNSTEMMPEFASHAMDMKMTSETYQCCRRKVTSGHLTYEKSSRCMKDFGHGLWCLLCTLGEWRALTLSRQAAMMMLHCPVQKNNEVTFYNKSSPASLGVHEALVLQQVQPYDSGKYQCFLAADIGEKDAESYVSLNVSECPTMRPTWPTTSNQCLFEVVEIPALWAVLPFILLCLVKVAICFITILICQKIRGSGDGDGVRKQKHTSHTYSQRNDCSSRSRKI